MKICNFLNDYKIFKFIYNIINLKSCYKKIMDNLKGATKRIFYKYTLPFDENC